MLRFRQHHERCNCWKLPSEASLLNFNLLASYRTITSRGQFNPIHDFSYGIAHSRKANNVPEFQNLITNPGPMRVGFSPDYLDWLYRGYKSKVKFTEAKARAERVFNGNLISSSEKSRLSNTKESNNANSTSLLPGQSPPGLFLRPRHSFRRRGGELQRAFAQSVLDETAQQQGLLDLIERQSQFPSIHIDKATRFHVVELFKELILDKALSPVEIWDKALLYRAILSERRASYPITFKYIFDHVANTLLANYSEMADSTSTNSNGSVGAAASQAASSRAGNMTQYQEQEQKEEEEESILMSRCPTAKSYYYFLYLVRRYYIDNAVEGHVVLRCHREANANQLLFSNPPPRDEQDVLHSIFTEINQTSNNSTESNKSSGNSASSSPSTGSPQRGNASRVRNQRLSAPSHYPPIEALWRCEENVPLLRILVFGELNLMVSENPFTKFPNAHSFLIRPYSAEGLMSLRSPTSSNNNRVESESTAGMNNNNNGNNSNEIRSKGGSNAYRREDEVSSLANLIAERRGHLLPPISRGLVPIIDTRGQDIQRLLQRHHREDVIGFQRLMRLHSAADANGVLYSSFADYAYFNPRTIRAEVRDNLQRKAIAALKMYQRAEKALYRESYETVQCNNLFRPLEIYSTIPSYIPTLPRFVSVIVSNPHVSLLLHTLPTKATTITTFVNSTEIENAQQTSVITQGELEKYVFQLARALHQVALNYHKEEVRRINRQKVNIAAVMLDRFVCEALKYIVRRQLHASTATVMTGAIPPPTHLLTNDNTYTGVNLSVDDISVTVEKLGQYSPFEHRALNENGFTTDARMEDYERWMAAPKRKV